MHIILGYLGSIITVLILINRLSKSGIDIGWLDPFKWHRRRQWRKKYYADPLFSIDDPMKATAGLLYTMVKCSGDISLEEKKFLLSTFQNDFQLSENEATDLLSDCSFHIKDENMVLERLEKYINPSLGLFTTSQKDSALELVEKVSKCAGSPNEKQIEFMCKITKIFSTEKLKSKW